MLPPCAQPSNLARLRYLAFDRIQEYHLLILDAREYFGHLHQKDD